MAQMKLDDPYAYAYGMLEVWVEETARRLADDPRHVEWVREMRRALARAHRAIKTKEAA
jgi:hypothetical protein